MKKLFFIAVVLILGLNSPAFGQEEDCKPKIGWIPIASSSAKGTDGQVQYNDGGRTAGANVFYDKAFGRVGIGNSSPDRELHIVGGDTPTIRLDQNNTKGWPPYIWDVAGNESNFFIRDITSGSSLPFRIKPGAPTNSIYIDSNGNVGIGTPTPDGKLDVEGTIFQRGSSLHADYVFNNDYALESIEEHARYMWENKHLKAVPKVQFDENGLEILELGSHRKGMLEELEKAHIYISHLNSQIASLKALVCQDHPDAEVCN